MFANIGGLVRIGRTLSVGGGDSGQNIFPVEGLTGQTAKVLEREDREMGVFRNTDTQENIKDRAFEQIAQQARGEDLRG